jgi:murein L,D-transpeptidase YafK
MNRRLTKSMKSVPSCLFSLAVALALFISPAQAASRGEMPLPERLLGALRSGGFQAGNPMFIRIFKKEAELELWIRKETPSGPQRFGLFATYPICALSGTLGPKIRKGDSQAPEGFYAVGPKQLNPGSRYHLAFNIGYPNSYDRAHGRTGSAIMVHGNCVSDGCFAMTDPAIEEIYGLAREALRRGQPFFRVHIFPFRLTGANLAAWSGSPWAPFWRMLREGYAYFERHKIPPNMEVRGGVYILSGT